MLTIPNLSAQHVFEDWVVTKGTQHMYVEGKSVRDINYNVYQVGATLNDDGNYDAIITKINRYGQEQWTQIFDGNGGDDLFTDVTISANGRINVTGVSANQTQTQSSVITVQLYASNGAIYWENYYAYSNSIFNGGAAITSDASNNVYITGTTTNTSTAADVLVLKYTSAGALAWANKKDMYGLMDAAVKIQMQGSFVVTTGGAQYDPSNWRYLTLKFNTSNGAFASSHVTTNNTTSIDQVKDMVVDGNGNIYITGSAGSTSQGYNMYTMKLDDELNVIWDHSYNYNGNFDDKAQGITLDNSNNVIITGTSDLGNGNSQFTTVKYSNTGAVLWAQGYDISNGADSAKAVSADTNGNIFVTGSFHNVTNQDIKTIKYSSTGTLIWEIDYNSVHNGNDIVLDMTYNDGLVIMTQSDKDVNREYHTIKYIEKDLLTPPDDEIIPSSGYFTSNAGILRNTAGNLETSVKYINTADYPAVYIADDKLSYVFTKTDSLADDTLHRVDMIFNKQRNNLKMYPLDKMEFYQNYYLPAVEGGKRERVPSYKKLISFDVWDNIDLMISNNNKGLKYYLVCKPGFNPSDLGWEYAGATSVAVNAGGDLVLETPIGSVTMSKGEAYEVTAGGTRIDKAWQPSFNANGSDVSLSIGSYNGANTLVLEVDKGLMSTSSSTTIGNMLWNSYYGGEHESFFKDVTVGEYGNIYICGQTISGNFPAGIGTVIGDHMGGYDALVIKLNEDIVPQWHSYFGGELNNTGGSGHEFPQAITIREPNFIEQGHRIYICGSTTSNDMPIEDNNGQFFSDDENNCSTGICFDGFIAQFNAFGSLIWSTYYGEDGYEFLYDIFAHEGNQLFAGGIKNENTILAPHYNGNGSNYTDGNGLLLQFDETTNLVWANAWDGEIIMGITVDQNKNIYTTGTTKSSNMPVLNFDPNYPETSTLYEADNNDIFINKFDPWGQLQFSFYMGGACPEIGSSIAVDDNFNVTVAGRNRITQYSTGPCDSESMPLIGNYYPSSGSGGTRDILIRVNASQTTAQLLYSSTFGGYGGTSGGFGGSALIPYDFTRPRVVTSQNGLLFLTSYLRPMGSSLMQPSPQPSGFYVKNSITQLPNSTSLPVGDSYIAAFDQNMNLVWSTYHGSHKYDMPGGIAVSESNQRLVFVGSGNWGAGSYTPGTFDPVEYNIPTDDDYYQSTPVVNISNWINTPTAALFDISQINLPVSTLDAAEKNRTISVWPNPTSSSLHLSSTAQIMRIEIFDLGGRLLSQQNVLNDFVIYDTYDLPPGMYIIRVITVQGKESVKFVKQ